MQRNLLAEVHLPNLDFKNQENIVNNSSSAFCYLLQENDKHVRSSTSKSLLHKIATPSMVSKSPAVGNKLSTAKKNIDTANGELIATKPFVLIEKKIKSSDKVVNLNSQNSEFSKNSLKLSESSGGHKLLNNGSSADGINVLEISSYSTGSLSSTDTYVNKCPTIEPNDLSETKSLCNVIVVKNSKGKTKFQIKLDKDFSARPYSDSFSFNPNSGSSCIEESKEVTKSINDDHDLYCESDSKPVCVISEVIGNADATFSGETDSFRNETEELNDVSDQFSNKTPDPTSKQYSPGDYSSQEICEDSLETLVTTENKINSGFFNKISYQKLIETAVVSSFKELNNESSNSKSDGEVSETGPILQRDLIEHSNTIFLDSNNEEKETQILNKIQIESNEGSTAESLVESGAKQFENHEESTSDSLSAAKQFENNEESTSDSSSAAKQLEPQLITPKKTNDITKIKGWRRKQFLIEKPTTVEFYRIDNGPRQKKIKVKDAISKPEEPVNVENAFVCDSLDEFLSKEVELKVGYEIPHLYAEVGIKLTSEDIASKPNLSEQDFKEVENRYCKPVLGGGDISDLSKINEESFKSGKRSIEDNSKTCKFLKLGESKQRSNKVSPKNLEQLKFEAKENAVPIKSTQDCSKVCKTELKDSNQSKTTSEIINNIRLESKLLGLVVYPRPLTPLHPIVRYHIRKLRSYTTRIDKNWANFAASAVFLNDKEYKRKILPVRCCVKIEKHANILNESKREVIEVKSSVEKKSKRVKKIEENTKCSKEKIKLKECSVVLERINIANFPSPWCMEHNVYDCEPCGLAKTKLNNFKSLTHDVQKLCTEKEVNDDPHEELAVSTGTSFDMKIANLLARKLRALKFKGDTSTSIECLKTLVPDSVEFIKLNFVKESFIKSHINVWYLKQESSRTRSRAFLTFSDAPPVPNAVNLRCNVFAPKQLPKVITEIVSSDKVFSPNEFAILHCNGKIWEIHGSLNIAFENSDKNIEQIFPSSHMPELEELQKVATDVLNVKAVKWWVLDLTQKFKLLEIKFGNVISIISRNKFIEMARCESHGFVPVRQDKKGRILGAYLTGSLLPFVLMGPYYLVESHNMSLKGEGSTLSFMYFVKENVVKDFPLKFFINSVIKDAEENDKVLDGLWLYDKTNLDNTSYLELMTRNLENSVEQSKFSSIDIEHGYSLNSLTNCLSSGNTVGVMKRKDSQNEIKRITVYLYFDVYELGYVEGELQRDNSVIICHPLDQRTKVKSHRMGDWFVRTIRRRIEFIPKDMEIKWFITKHKEDLRERRPFNKFMLGGAHVLTRNGVFYLLEMSESRIAKLGLEKSDVVKAITESHIIGMVMEMKNLAGLLSDNNQEKPSMEKVLSLALKEIENLKMLEETLRSEKIKAEEKRMVLTSNFLMTLGSCKMKNKFKLKMIEDIEHLFVKRNGDLSEDFVKKLIKYKIGRQYLRRNGKFYQYIEKVRDTSDSNQRLKRNRMEKCKKLQIFLNSFKQGGSSGLKSLIKKSATPKDKSPDTFNTVHSYEESPESVLSALLENKFNSPSEHVSFCKNTFPEKTILVEDSKRKVLS